MILFGICLFLLAIGIFILAGCCLDRNDIFWGIVSICMACIFICYAVLVISDPIYKAGQVDCLNGKIQYQHIKPKLVDTTADMKYWEKIK